MSKYNAQSQEYTITGSVQTYGQRMMNFNSCKKNERRFYTNNQRSIYWQGVKSTASGNGWSDSL
jgi:hypothetical protein